MAQSRWKLEWHNDTIFDEATSALASLSKEISAARTQMTILTAHRLATVLPATTIYVLEKGSIVEHGKHAAWSRRAACTTRCGLSSLANGRRLIGPRWLLTRPIVHYNGRMDNVMDKTGAQLAARIRLERDARAWSLTQLAERAGVAKATISKIERCEVSPTAVILVRIAAAFDLTLAGLLLRAEGEAGGRLVRASDQARWQDPATGYLRRQIMSRPDHPVELVQVSLPPGRSVVLPASSYARIRQVVWLQTGRLTIIDDGVRSDLEEGDCLAFGPPAEVSFINQSAAPCTYLVALARS